MLVRYYVKFLPYPIVEILKEIRRKLYRFRKPKVSKIQIINDLKKLGVEEGDVLYVFSSLKSIGYVPGGPEVVIDALTEALGPDGTLVLPCFYFIGGEMTLTLEENKIFNPKTTPTVLGLIPEAFRRRPGVYRSVHPTHSVCAFGSRAKWITDGHENCATTFGKGTPFDKMMELDAKSLGIGVNIFRVISFIHYFEDVTDNFPINVYCEKKYEVRVIADGEIKTMKVKAHDPEVAKTRTDHKQGEFIREYLTDYLIHRGLLKVGFVGEAESWVIRVRDFVKALKELAEMNITVYTTREELNNLLPSPNESERLGTCCENSQ